MLDQMALPPVSSEVAGKITPQLAARQYSSVLLQLVPPYASLFLDEEAMLNGPEAERVEVLYRRHGFRISPEWRAGPADHLGLELLFLAHLYEHEPDVAPGFLRANLLPWAPVCLLAIGRIQPAPLYAELAGRTLDVLQDLRP